MKHIFALLFGISLTAGAMAQVPDSIASSPYSCKYINETSFVCEKRKEAEDPEAIPRLEENKSSIPEREKKFNPDNKEIDRNKPEKQIQHKYSKPEKESDSGMLESDLDDIEIDSSTIIKAGVHDKSVRDELRDRNTIPANPNSNASVKKDK